MYELKVVQHIDSAREIIVIVEFFDDVDERDMKNYPHYNTIKECLAYCKRMAWKLEDIFIDNHRRFIM